MKNVKYIPVKAIKINLPEVRQEEDWSCGAAVLLSVLLHYGKGPLTEKMVGDKLKMDETGTDPFQIKRVLMHYKIKFREYRDMTIEQLKQNVSKGYPVLIMLQAWGDNPELYTCCKADCEDGHWLIAIGYDKDNIYFEDPVLDVSRGYISIKELDARWHDYEYLSEKDSKARNRYHSDHYGIAITVRRQGSKKVQVEAIL